MGLGIFYGLRLFSPFNKCLAPQKHLCLFVTSLKHVFFFENLKDKCMEFLDIIMCSLKRLPNIFIDYVLAIF